MNILLRLTLQRHKIKNLKQIVPEKELRGFRPNFRINVSVSDLYIPAIGLPAYSAAGKCVDRSWEYKNHSQTHECGNWDLCRAISFLGIHKWDFLCSAPNLLYLRLLTLLCFTPLSNDPPT